MIGDVDVCPEQDVSLIEAIQRGVRTANIPALLPVLVQMTGDLRWVRNERYRPSAPRGFDDNDSGGLPDEIGSEIRNAAAQKILEWLHGIQLAIEEPSPELLVEMLSFIVGERVPDEYGAMAAATLRDVAATADTFPPERADGPQVIVIGAGISGLCAAVTLKRAGMRVTVLERNESPGGTWAENRYPGAGVDTPSHLYEFSFAPYDWPEYFARQGDVQAYLEHVVARFGLAAHLELGVSVISATYEAGGWTVETQDVSGARTVRRADVVISAVGAFNSPKFPDVAGLDRFEGEIVHTARWRPLDLSGRRVAVIGNGASAMQTVPAVVDEVASLTVFQRSPHWIAPFDKFHRSIPTDLRTLLDRVPLYRAWTRIRLGWSFNDQLHPTLFRDPSWPHQARSLNEVNDRHRRIFTSYLRAQLGDRDHLVAALTPSYPPYGKRILLDNGWFQALCREHVRLVTVPVRELTGEGVVTADGEMHPCDVVIMATGFDVVRFLSTFEVVGRQGARLREVWDDEDARAYMGVAVPGFPNFFMLYGPNTQPGHGGSLIAAVEAQMTLVAALIERFVADGRPLEVDAVAFEKYNALVDDLHGRMVWTHPGVDNYYRNSRGRVVVNNPFRIVDFWNSMNGEALEAFIPTTEDTVDA